ncbi:hypothetical protein CPT75_05640 [Butyrivibrio fibrisolvens]|uniref:Uncharacterized protein n=1 Tax=Butyrivibrio fibrisolvens TaxID=831 RepID=A0A317FY49_BUTFI|nr:hypothetical protein CPT75_05640 [Butyrivibrio fibrisolvens]
MIDKKKMIYKIVGGIFYVIMILVLSFICWKMEKRVLSIFFILLPISFLYYYMEFAQIKKIIKIRSN